MPMMNRNLLLMLPGLMTILVAGAVGARSPEQGRMIYEARCAVCHGNQGRGDGPEAPFLSPRPASLISAGTSAKSDADLLTVITNGKPRTAMPAWKDSLTEEQRRDVLAYIRTLVRFGPKPLTPAPPQEQH
ncbi:MAG: cytochrome c [Nitrospirae bacterium]|nr:MAG: cytochrome c [Nitrospirota bacterium]